MNEIYKVFGKVCFPNFLKENKWYKTYLKAALKLNNAEFKKYMEQNNLIYTVEKYEMDIKEKKSLELKQ